MRCEGVGKDRDRRHVSFGSKPANNPMKTKTPTLNVSPRFSLRLGPALLLAALIACCPLQTRANTIALSFTGGGPNGIIGDTTLGWAFTLSSPVLLTDLGLWDENGTGLAESHLVTVWTSTGIQEAQVTIPSGTAGTTLTDGFRYVSVLPVLLPAGSYTIGAFFRDSGPDRFTAAASTITTASGVTYDGSRSESGNAFPPGDTVGAPNSFFGPNFQFTTPSSVPDASSTWTLLLLGVTATFGLNFFVRRSA